MRTMFLSACGMLIFASGAGAQILRAPRAAGSPVVVNTSIGFLRTETIFDGSSGSVWDFGSALELRLSLEKRVGSVGNVGVAISRASVPLVYSLIDPTSPTATPCTNQSDNRCDARTNLTTIVASFSSSGTYGIHQLINLGIGVSMFGDFVEDGTGTRLAPLSADRDFFVDVGFGVGFGISEHFAVSLIQGAGFVVHQRTGLSGNRDTFHQLYATRLGLRLAIGR